ncbi:MAG: RDD family protein [Planctomycetota bacterium]|jgi:uncharacterized RDD family membrane protein YckC
MAGSPQIPDELRRSILARRKRVGIVRVTFAISIALMVFAFFYANESSTLTPAARYVSILSDADDVWLLDVQRTLKSTGGEQTGKFQLHRLRGDEIKHGPLISASPDSACLLPGGKMGVISGSRMILIDLNSDDWSLEKNIQLARGGDSGVNRLVVVGGKAFVVWNENHVEDKSPRSRIGIAELVGDELKLETAVTSVNGHIDSMGCVARGREVWLVYHLRNTNSMRMVVFTPEFTESSGRAVLQQKAHVSDDVAAVTYTTTGNARSPFVVGMRKVGDESRNWILSVFDGEEWHKAAAPSRDKPASSLDISISMDMAWHNDELWSVYTDGKKIKLAKGNITTEHSISWGQGDPLELDKSRDSTEMMAMLGVLVVLAMLTFLQAVWLMLNRSRGLERALENVIDKSDEESTDVLGPKPKEKRPLFASPIARASALMIDLVMTAPIVMMLRGVYNYDLVNAYSFLNVGSAMMSEDSLFVVLRATLVTMLILTVYSSTCEYFWGKTFGKALFRLRVESVDGEPAAPWQVMLRNVVKIFELAHYILVLIPMAFMLMSTKQQRLGDYLARTIVILDVVPEEQADDLDV